MEAGNPDHPSGTCVTSRKDHCSGQGMGKKLSLTVPKMMTVRESGPDSGMCGVTSRRPQQDRPCRTARTGRPGLEKQPPPHPSIPRRIFPHLRPTK